jgi:hypothetical protein
MTHKDTEALSTRCLLAFSQQSPKASVAPMGYFFALALLRRGGKTRSNNMVILITIRNAGDNYFYHNFSVYNVKMREPLNLNKIVFSSKREYLYEQDMEDELREHPEFKRAGRIYRIIGKLPCYVPTGRHIEYLP